MRACTQVGPACRSALHCVPQLTFSWSPAEQRRFVGPCLHLLPTHNPCSAVWCCCCAGKKGGVANGAASPATSDDQQEQEEEDSELAALMPHLAYCLASPSPSGTSSPVPHQSAPAITTAGTQRLSGLGPNAEAANALQTAFATAGANGPQGQQAEGYTPADLVQAVDFHLQMFTNLKREVGARCLAQPGECQRSACLSAA